jgi:zinc protease
LADRIAAVFQDYPAAKASSGPELARQPVDTSGALRTEQRDKAQTALAMVFPGPSRQDHERSAAEVWAAVAGGLGGRLFEILRSQQSLAYTVVASSWQRHRAGALLAYLATSPGREQEARESLHLELQRFAAEPVSADELSRAVNYLAGQQEIARQSSSAIMGEILDAWFAGEGLDDLVDPWRRYRLVTVDDVTAVCRRAFTGEQFAEGVVRGRVAEGAASR